MPLKRFAIKSHTANHRALVSLAAIGAGIGQIAAQAENKSRCGSDFWYNAYDLVRYAN
jgi:hypothetical protein